MLDMNNNMMLFAKIVMKSKWLFAITLVLSLLAGCAGTDTEGVSVERLKDDREGFIIKETSTMDDESLENFEHAVAMMNNNDYENAIELFEKVIEGSPGVTAPYVNIAMAYVKIDKLESAEKHLQTALAIFPDHPVVCNEYGLLLRKSGRFTEARDVYEKALKSYPEYLPVRRNLGILCDLYLNDQECALKQYEKYSEAMPDDEQVKMWVADLRMRLGR